MSQLQQMWATYGADDQTKKMFGNTENQLL